MVLHLQVLLDDTGLFKFAVCLCLRLVLTNVLLPQKFLLLLNHHLSVRHSGKFGFVLGASFQFLLDGFLEFTQVVLLASPQVFDVCLPVLMPENLFVSFV